jgi:hypothetical protein
MLTKGVLLNILIALYNSAYVDITDNATDEYLALVSSLSLYRVCLFNHVQFAKKCLQYVRAPDENVFIPRTPPFLIYPNVAKYPSKPSI